MGFNGVAAAYGGTNYQNAISGWVNLITQNGMVAIVDLHWTAPGTTLSNAQEPMADADHAPTVWSQIAKTFAGNGSVIFDLFNEPFITDWSCWVSGGSCAQLNGTNYTVAGMAALLQAVRNAGAQNVVILGGLSYSSDMSQWVSSVNGIPTLPSPLNGISIANVAASWHAYDFNSEQSGCPSQYNGYSTSLTCNSAEVTATNTSATSVLAAGFPLVIGESGISAFSASDGRALHPRANHRPRDLVRQSPHLDGDGRPELPRVVVEHGHGPRPDYGLRRRHADRGFRADVPGAPGEVLRTRRAAYRGPLYY